MSSYPFRGPRFALGDQLRVRQESEVLFRKELEGSCPESVLIVWSVRDHDVPVDPDGQPYSLDYSEQLVTIEGWAKEHPAFHFELIAHLQK